MSCVAKDNDPVQTELPESVLLVSYRSPLTQIGLCYAEGNANRHTMTVLPFIFADGFEPIPAIFIFKGKYDPAYPFRSPKCFADLAEGCKAFRWTKRLASSRRVHT